MKQAKPLPWQHRAAGFSLLELAVVVSVVGILAGILLTNVLSYRDEAELAAVGQVTGALRSALHLKTAQLFVRHQEDQMAALAEQNPMDWLAERPRNYLGEFYAPIGQDLTPGNWYFDRKDKLIVYLLNYGKTVGKDAPKVMKFKVKLARLTPEPGKPPGTPGFIEGVVLEQVN